MTNEDGDTAGWEATAEMLGDPLPSDWRDAGAVQARRDHLAASAYATAEAALEMLVVAAELRRRGERASPDGGEMRAYADALLDLDRAWRRYVHDTQRDADRVVYDAAEFWVGSLVAAFVEGGL